MNIQKLEIWLSNDRIELKNLVKETVREHVSTLKSKHEDIYGYSILVGEPYEISYLTAISNNESDLSEDTAYDRFCVDEWQSWDYNVLNPVLLLCNKLTKSLKSYIHKTLMN